MRGGYSPAKKGEKRLIVLKNVVFHYPSSDFTLSIKKLSFQDNENTAILGTAGSGKTTLLRLIAGELSPQRGTIRIAGERLTQQNKHVLGRKLGSVWQTPTRLKGGVLAETAAGAMECGFPPPLAEQLARQAMGLLHISQLEKRECRSLSLTERHHVELARALAKHPPFLLLDDPAALMDASVKRGFLPAMQFLPHAVLITGSHTDLPLLLCSRAVILKNGEILADGEPHKLLRDLPLLKEAGLELPARFW